MGPEANSGINAEGAQASGSVRGSLSTGQMAPALSIMGAESGMSLQVTCVVANEDMYLWLTPYSFPFEDMYLWLTPYAFSIRGCVPEANSIWVPHSRTCTCG